MEMLEISQICYAEKHRVYEMFRNVIKALVMCQPPDPLRFIVWYLKHRHHEDVPKIILVAPPGLVTADKVCIALDVAKSTGVVTIDRRNVMRRHRRKQENGGCSADFISTLTEYMRAKGASKKGWLMLDIPNSCKEANQLIRVGILPTHTILLNMVVDYSKKDQNMYTIEKLDQLHERFELEMKTKFRYSLKELHIRDKSINDIVELCLEQIFRQRPLSTVPFVPRITLIGPKGSRRLVTARGLSEKFNIVHVDLDQYLVQKKIDDYGKSSLETLYSWLKDRITRTDCLEKGYVLTGFPRTKTDFEWLDSIEVAPNRVIFFSVDFREVYSRLRNRCIDKKSGTVISLDQAVAELKAGSLKIEHLRRYPLDRKILFCQFKTYCNSLKDMLYYCGNSCSVVMADSSQYERVLACILAGSPASGPRPQNRMPSRLTESLNEKMLLSYNDSTLYENTNLSKDAKNLLHALEYKDAVKT